MDGIGDCMDCMRLIIEQCDIKFKLNCRLCCTEFKRIVDDCALYTTIKIPVDKIHKVPKFWLDRKQYITFDVSNSNSFSFNDKISWHLIDEIESGEVTVSNPVSKIDQTRLDILALYKSYGMKIDTFKNMNKGITGYNRMLKHVKYIHVDVNIHEIFEILAQFADRDNIQYDNILKVTLEGNINRVKSHIYGNSYGNFIDRPTSECFPNVLELTLLDVLIINKSYFWHFPTDNIITLNIVGEYAINYPISIVKLFPKLQVVNCPTALVKRFNNYTGCNVRVRAND
jgi:hypothetical protein